jgi:hypothetical protein
VGAIFITYRREDSAATCGRIYDRLAAHFGRDVIFKDVDSIPLGVNFPDFIGGVTAQASVGLVIIGPSFLTIRGPYGRRLDDPTDHVRIEIESMLRRGIPVIPVMVQLASIPTPDQLPESIRSLVVRNGIPIRYDPDFDGDMRRLIAAIERWVPARRAGAVPGQSPWQGPATAGTTPGPMSEGKRRGPWGFLGRTESAVIIVAGVLAILAYVGIRLFAPGTSSPPASGAPYYVDDASSQITYSGPWQSDSGNAGFYDGTQHYTGPTWHAHQGDYAQLTFTGTQIAYYAIVDTHHGNVDVQLDGSYQTTVDLYRPERRGDVLVWTSPLLPRGSHTIRLIYDDTKNPASTDATVTLDAFNIVP